MFFFGQYRIGEAANPGPAQQWVLGAVNPTGLSGKAEQFNDLSRGIFSVCETHLTIPGCHRFKQELFGVRSKFKFYGGHPAPYKTSGAQCVGGKHTGVGFLASVPSRSVFSGWNSSLYQTSRIHAASFMVGQTWITGAVVYGYAWNHASAEVRENTNELLREASRIISSDLPGLKFIAGDFNQLEGILPETKEWESKGWCDIQTLASKRWNIQPGPTCKHKTRKDFIYMSPALQELVTSVSNEFDRFPDHSTLMAILSPPSNEPIQFVWPKPKHIDFGTFEEVNLIRTSEVSEGVGYSDDPSEHYLQICQNFEDHVHQTRLKNNKPGLLKPQRGRAKTTDRVVLSCKPSPLKPSRPGEAVPLLQTNSLQHKRWFVQLRRLTSFVNHRKQGRTDVKAQQHALSLWHSILNAPGFPKGFASWWNVRSLHSQAPQVQVPMHPPDFHEATMIRDAFQLEVNEFEAILKQSIAKADINRHAHNANQVFRDVRKPGPVPVQVLVAKTTANVVEVVDPFVVRIDHSSESNSFRSEHPLQCHWGQLTISAINESTVTFTQEHGLQIGDVITQSDLLATPQELHDAFEHQWSKRWDKHANLSPNHWDEICNFIDLAFPQGSLPIPPITREVWLATIKSRKSTSAVGLDGVSRADLLAMPDEFHDELLRLLSQVETTGRWPTQLMQGAVNALEKVQGADSVNQYRPITILPIIYRIWGTIRGKAILEAISSIAPPGLRGNMPNCTSVSLWWELQSRIEASLYDGSPSTGLVSDLVKAFNLLPRLPIFHLASRIGIASGVIRAWASAAGSITRRFMIHGQPSNGLRSTTGLPEGCALSVCGMALCNLLVHKWMELKHPEVELLTYVDNIELVSQSTAEILSSHRSLKQIYEILDLELDGNKTYLWSTDANQRSTIREHDFAPQESARDMGGHMQYNAKRGNAVVKAKCEDAKSLWPRLARSRAPHHQKLRVLKTVAWPSSLHGISTVTLNDQIFTSLRSGAFQSLRLDRWGANSQIHLSLVEKPLCDPEFYALWNSLVQFRVHAIEEVSSKVFSLAAEVPPRNRKPGPYGTLLTRLQAIDWHWCGGNCFADHNQLPIDLLNCPYQEMYSRVARAWTQHVGSLWATRKGFRGFENVDVGLSRISPDWSLEESGLLRVLQNGTAITNDLLHHAFQSSEATCRFCGEVDSLHHRHWQCRDTQASRDKIPIEVLSMIDELPEVTTSRGWICEPPSVRVFKRSTFDIPDKLLDFELPPAWVGDFQELQLFTDGAGLTPAIPASRVVAWAVIIANHPCDSQGSSPFSVVSAGGVPGYWQTITRSELCAVISAVAFACQIDKPCCIWCDNLGVVRKARRFMRKPHKVHKSNDHDLWVRFLDCVAMSRHSVRLVHVHSHQEHDLQPDWKAWAFYNNDVVDKLAAQTLRMLPAHVLENHRQAAFDIQQSMFVKQHLHQHYVRVGQMSIAKPLEKAEAPRQPPSCEDGDALIVRFDELANFLVSNAPSRLRFSGWDRILTWFQTIAPAGQQSEFITEWVSWYELLWSFQLSSGCRGVVSTSSHNTWALDDLKREYDGPKATRNFSSYLTHLIQLRHPDWKPINHRPSNYRFQCWSMSIKLAWTSAARNQLNDWLTEVWGTQHFHNVGKGLGLVPPAVREVVEVPVTRSFGLHRFFQSHS